MATFRDFSSEYPDHPEKGMRAAINYMVTTSEIPNKFLAGDLDLSPTEFSRMTAVEPSDDHYQRRSPPPGIVIRLMRKTQNSSPLATALGYLGYDAARLEEIRPNQAAILRQPRGGVRAL